MTSFSPIPTGSSKDYHISNVGKEDGSIQSKASLALSKLPNETVVLKEMGEKPQIAYEVKVANKVFDTGVEAIAANSASIRTLVPVTFLKGAADVLNGKSVKDLSKLIAKEKEEEVSNTEITGSIGKLSTFLMSMALIDKALEKK